MRRTSDSLAGSLRQAQGRLFATLRMTIPGWGLSLADAEPAEDSIEDLFIDVLLLDL
jgi:hypothetical protein